ncbi:hypothetical protein FB45DRAFT_1017539 [Roridomyces roridus]|uniref:Uncharacterized protein n=1 Tax=Roridomyces roridus TaxID=1738132 RepID=A0AAD7CJB7_9AGAR|nr:hypothetical protein FB45DRAFT_1017539 [Roridomyces roridus]
MQARRPASGLTPLAIVLPHPSLPRRRSLLSSVPSPRTPLRGGSPTCSSLVFATNRKSTDSWNSSNQDLTDDLDYDWKPDQIRLLRRTLDALPPHLMTPFNGPIPPSNLLDKIARGVTQAKGEDWPHSLRATRVKLIEVARAIAEEDCKPRKSIPEESAMDTSDYPSIAEADVLQPTTNIGLGTTGLGIGIERRPLYRQSSMDFLNNASEPHNSDSINRLSTRLQQADRYIPNSLYHPYSRSQIQRRSSSPPRASHIPSLINPSTPSTSTLSSLATLSATSAPRLRRTVSTASSLTTSDSRMSVSSSGLPPVAADPRVQRVRRSDSFCGPSEFGVRHPVKRAPSYGALAQEARDKMPTDADITIPCPSSDEEEKIRTRRAKKPRTRTTSVSSPPPRSPTPSSPSSAATASPRSKTASPEEARPKRSSKKTRDGADLSKAVGPKRMNLKRNPSMFGDELPQLSPSPLPRPVTPTYSLGPSAAPLLQPQTPDKVKTLRRVRRLPAARRISFGSLIAPVGEDGHEADMEECDDEHHHGLASAFQLR